MLDYVSVAIGLLLLVWSANMFVTGAANIARYIRVPLFFIGFLIVGIGTSAPEMIVAAMASLDGNIGLAIGNGLGANIANIAMVLGVAAIVSPIIVDKNTIKTQLPLLFVFTTIAYYVFLDNHISRPDGFLLLSCMIFSLYLLFKMTPRSIIEEVDPEILEREGIEIPDNEPLSKSIILCLIGCVILFAGSKLLTYGAINIAKSWGVTDLVIGLTIVAIGTSLPELSATIAAAMKKQHDLAFGNIIGSNMFNTLIVLAIPGVIAPGDVPPEAVLRDFTIVIGLTILLMVYCGARLVAKRKEIIKGFEAKGLKESSTETQEALSGNFSYTAIGRKEATILLILFISYEILLFTTP